MARGHPRDSLGRVLPHPGWPDDRTAPGTLELVRRFGNSINRENGAERFPSPAALDAWLSTEQLGAVDATSADFARVIAVRDAIHLLAVANGRDERDPGAWRLLGEVLGPVRLGLRADDDGISLEPAAADVDGLLGLLGLTIVAATADGSWHRLKACRHCHWLVFDPSKNRSARWCSMSACGGRHNAREYRRRHRAG